MQLLASVNVLLEVVRFKGNDWSMIDGDIGWCLDVVFRSVECELINILYVIRKLLQYIHQSKGVR